MAAAPSGGSEAAQESRGSMRAVVVLAQAVGGLSDHLQTQIVGHHVAFPDRRSLAAFPEQPTATGRSDDDSGACTSHLVRPTPGKSCWAVVAIQLGRLVLVDDQHRPDRMSASATRSSHAISWSGWQLPATCSLSTARRDPPLCDRIVVSWGLLAGMTASVRTARLKSPGGCLVINLDKRFLP